MNEWMNYCHSSWMISRLGVHTHTYTHTHSQIGLNIAQGSNGHVWVIYGRGLSIMIWNLNNRPRLNSSRRRRKRNCFRNRWVAFDIRKTISQKLRGQSMCNVHRRGKDCGDNNGTRRRWRRRQRRRRWKEKIKMRWNRTHETKVDKNKVTKRLGSSSNEKKWKLFHINEIYECRVHLTHLNM